MKAVTGIVGLTATLAAGALAVTLAQTPAPAPQPTPAFRLGVDLVPVDVSIVGDDSQPLTSLTAADFALEVDGKPRRIVSSQYISSVHEVTPPAAFQSTFSSNAAGSGRLIMFVVDRANIAPGRGRQAMEAASRFLARLTPADRVGLIAFPAASPTIDFTANHALVQSALPGLTGLSDTFPSTYRIGIAEAMDIGLGNRTALNTVVQRECTSLPSDQERDSCRNEIVRDANGMFSDVNERTRTALTTLRLIVDRLAQTPTPKTIVYISEGLVVERPSDLAWLSPAAARGQVTIYPLQLEIFASDASTAREAATPGRDRALAREGLELVAGSTRGTVLPVVARADNAFARLALELSGYYLVSFEPESGDRDSKPHKIKVNVPGRTGLTVRARSEFSIEPPAAKADDVVLQETLQAPMLASEIGLKLATYTLRDPASDKLRILMAADIDRSGNPDGRLALAYSLVNDQGRLIDSQIDRAIKTPVSPDTAIQKYSGFILSGATGTHTLKIAVVDERGRRGSVEHSFRAALTPVGQVRATDLLIADDRTTSGSAAPVVGSAFTSGMVNSYIEIYADTADLLKNTTVMFEVASDEQARALDGAAGRVQPATADSPNRRALEGSIPLALLPPGDYVARAVVSTDGRKVGQVTRPFRVGRMAAPAKPAAGTSRLTTSRPGSITLASRTERFDRASVLTPQVVDFFVERLNVAARGEANPAPVVEHARAGRFEDAVKSLSNTTESVSAAFLTGLGLYAKGELEPAAARFREALRLDSEFFPAAFYLGFCYAAGGRDLEAVGAWQLALVTESEAPFIFTLLGDALLRLRDVERALEILNEAAAAWPDNEEVQVRIGSALAMSGKRAEALLKLEPYLEKHPDNQERLFVGLRTIYDARAAGKPIRSTNEDRALFARWAAAYRAAKGPQLALVEQWQKSVGK